MRKALVEHRDVEMRMRKLSQFKLSFLTHFTIKIPNVSLSFDSEAHLISVLHKPNSMSFFTTSPRSKGPVPSKNGEGSGLGGSEPDQWWEIPLDSDEGTPKPEETPKKEGPPEMKTSTPKNKGKERFYRDDYDSNMDSPGRSKFEQAQAASEARKSKRRVRQQADRRKWEEEKRKEDERHKAMRDEFERWFKKPVYDPLLLEAAQRSASKANSLSEWAEACQDFFDKKPGAEFPVPPKFGGGCRQKKCVKGEELGVCHHEVER
ncbi:hypothetical protein G7Y89_g10606 [Cudoniella acicularis]|uniref:Uncharacterized protein n=1 Tax=Cudoniella acicularis TaxID=354080 RepID=A0A8H4RDI4_9HELO|nr:hypothetical protein G7Y89_g10606 [Cudoniella acicularis]